jgi:hypothetical protein
MRDHQNKIIISFFSFIALIFIAFHTIEFVFLNRLYNWGEGKKIYTISKSISYLFIFALPLVFLKLFKIIYLKKFIFFFISWIFFSTSLSFVISITFGYSSEFSNTLRTVEQLGGFILGLVCGYYISRLNVDKSIIIVKAIKISIFFLFIGIVYQIFFLDTGTILYDRLHGVSGEPKGLGLSLVPYIVALVATLGTINYQKILIIIACVVALIFTKSPTALLSLIFMMLIFYKINGFLKVKYLKIFFLILFPFIGIFFNDNLNNMLLGRISDYLNAKTYSGSGQEVLNFPLIGEITVEGNELPVYLFFKDNPFFIITGVGLGQESFLSNNYIKQLGGSGFLQEDFSGYISPNFALLANTSNFGLIWVLSLAIWAIVLAHKLNNYLEGDKRFIFYFFLSHFLLTLLIFRTTIPISTSIIVLSSFIFSKQTIKCYKK